MKPKLRLFIVTVGLLLCVAAPILLVSSGRNRSSSVREASLVFIGFTNIPTKGDGALFYCTNGSAKPVGFVVKNFDTFASGRWETHRIGNGDRSGGLTDEAKRWLYRFDVIPTQLGPAMAATFFVPSPETNKAWRVRFKCVEQTVGDKIRKHTIGGMELPGHALILNGDYFTGRTYDLCSTEVSR